MWLRVPKTESSIIYLSQNPFPVCSRVGGVCPELRSSLVALGSIFYPFLCSVTHVRGKRDQGCCSECNVPADVVFHHKWGRRPGADRRNQSERKSGHAKWHKAGGSQSSLWLVLWTFWIPMIVHNGLLSPRDSKLGQNDEPQTWTWGLIPLLHEMHTHMAWCEVVWLSSWIDKVPTVRSKIHNYPGWDHTLNLHTNGAGGSWGSRVGCVIYSLHQPYITR